MSKFVWTFIVIAYLVTGFFTGVYFEANYNNVYVMDSVVTYKPICVDKSNENYFMPVFMMVYWPFFWISETGYILSGQKEIYMKKVQECSHV